MSEFSVGVFSRLSSIGLLWLSATGACFAQAPEQHAVFGQFRVASGSADVTISDCGDGTPCGVVSRIDPDTLEAGVQPSELRDVNNPEPTLRDRPLVGMLMLDDFRRADDDWRGGRIYDAESGKTYGARLQRLSNGDLQVKGCIGPFCQTQIWTPLD